MGQCKLKKPSESNSFREIFHCGMTILRKTNLGVFIQCQYTRIILKKIWDRVCLKNNQNLKISMKYFTVA